MPSANDPKAFGERFRAAMLHKGYGRLGATELAEALSTELPGGLSVQTAHKWVNGTAIPRPDRAAVLARWLDVSEHWLRFGPDPESEGPKGGETVGRVLGADELARRVHGLTEQQRKIFEALLLEFEKARDC